MKFEIIADAFEKLENTPSRNDMTEILVNTYALCDLFDSQVFSYLLMGRVAPLFINSEFNFSEKSLQKLLSQIVEFANSKIDVNEMRSSSGDIGITSEEVLKQLGYGSNLKETLSVEQVYEQLWKIVNSSGTGSSTRKGEILRDLFSQVRPKDAKYIARVVTGKIRIGASDRTVLDAFSFMLSGDKSYRNQLDTLYGVDPDLGHLAFKIQFFLVGASMGDMDEENRREIIEKAIFSEDLITPTAGVPILSRLVERVVEFSDVFTRLGEDVYIQPKYDGLRCQIHKGVDYGDQLAERIWARKLLSKEGEEASMSMFESEPAVEGNVKLFSRSLEDITDMFPEIVDFVTKLDSESFILDGEIVGWDAEKRSYVPFQETMTRKRKFGIEAAVESVPVRYYLFDILALDGKSLLHEDFQDRLKLLNSFGDLPIESSSKGESHLLVITDTTLIHDEDHLDELFSKAVDDGLEGLIAKSPVGGYQPGRRNFEWLKLKRSMDKNLVDSVDVVIMGYYYGSGRRSDLGIGALLAGIPDKDGNIYSLTKIGTGVTDQLWKDIVVKLADLKAIEKPKEYIVSSELEPDVWVSPEVVSSVESDEITRSTVHTAGMLGAGGEGGEAVASKSNGKGKKKVKGVALRFPRLIIFDTGKRVEDATSVSELLGMSKIVL